jgi:hypothetical protein
LGWKEVVCVSHICKQWSNRNCWASFFGHWLEMPLLSGAHIVCSKSVIATMMEQTTSYCGLGASQTIGQTGCTAMNASVGTDPSGDPSCVFITHNWDPHCSPVPLLPQGGAATGSGLGMPSF